MTERVISVAPESPIEYAESLVLEHRFSALPVVNEANGLVGIVSVIDLLRARRDASAPETVGAVMSWDPIWMTPDANIGILAHRLRMHGELRVMPIADRGFLVGVVTRSDLLRKRPGGGPPGRALRRWLRRLSRPFTDQPRIGVDDGRDHREPVSDPVTVSDVMTSKDLLTVSETTPVQDAVSTLLERRFTALPVVAGGKLIGLVSEADLIHDPLAGRRTPRAPTIAGLMTTKVATSAPEAPVEDVVRLLVDEGLRVVPVVSGGLLVGVVTRADLLRLPVAR